MKKRSHHTKNVSNAQPIGTQRKGRPNLRWIDGLEKDLLVLRTRSWRAMAVRRLAGKGFLRRQKPTLGCCASEDGRDLISSVVSRNF
ncbi:hypothetical protein TNCV_1314131 [Trichonephila clavipes]|nr:hypothetical protein TNCV_1314131 [Trichonephila clavipes]